MAEIEQFILSKACLARAFARTIINTRMHESGAFETHTHARTRILDPPCIAVFCAQDSNRRRGSPLIVSHAWSDRPLCQIYESLTPVTPVVSGFQNTASSTPTSLQVALPSFVKKVLQPLDLFLSQRLPLLSPARLA